MVNFVKIIIFTVISAEADSRALMKCIRAMHPKQILSLNESEEKIIVSISITAIGKNSEGLILENKVIAGIFKEELMKGLS